MTGYVKIFDKTDGIDTIRSGDFESEFTAIQSAFDQTSGHKHNGTASEGPYIQLVSDSTNKNKVIIDGSNNEIEFWNNASGLAVQQLSLTDGLLAPVTTNDVDLGSSTKYFKNIYGKNIYGNVPNVVNVKTYGAVGDGATDDTSAVQDAIDALSPGQILDLGGPPNVFLVGNLTVTNKTFCGIIGRGASLKFSGTASGAGLGIQLVGTITDFVIRGVKFVGDGVKANKHAAIWSNSGQTLRRLLITENHITDCMLGIALNSALSGTLQNCWVINNYVYGSVGIASGQGYGISLAAQVSTDCESVVAYNMVDGCSRHGIYISQGDGFVVHGNVVSNHRANLTGAEQADGTDGWGRIRPAICVQRSNRVIVSSNIVRDFYDGAILVTSTDNDMYGLTVIGNHCQGAVNAVPPITIGSGSPIAIGGFITYDVNITDNYIEHTVSIDAIRLRDGKRVTIKGNHINITGVTSSTSGIFIYNTDDSSGTADYSDKIVVTDNLIHMTNGSGGTSYGVRLEASACTSEAQIILRDNTVSGDIAVPVIPAVAITNTNYRRISTQTDHLVTNGDADATLTWGVSGTTQLWNTALSTTRAVSLATTSALPTGARFRVVRTAAATGASNLNVGSGPLKALTPGTWCDVSWDGSAWILSGYGAL